MPSLIDENFPTIVVSNIEINNKLDDNTTHEDDINDEKQSSNITCDTNIYQLDSSMRPHFNHKTTNNLTINH